MNLDQIEPGETFVVEKLHIQGTIARRLRDLGLTEGMKITCVGKSPLGNPSAYLIMGSVFALRAKDCKQIEGRRDR